MSRASSRVIECGRGCNDLEGERLQGIGRQYRGGLVEFSMDRGLATAQIIVIHRRQIVVDERECVNEFDRSGRRIEFFRIDVQAFTRRIDELWPHALAAGKYRITHRLVEPLRCPVLCRQRPIEATHDALRPGLRLVRQ